MALQRPPPSPTPRPEREAAGGTEEEGEGPEDSIKAESIIRRVCKPRDDDQIVLKWEYLPLKSSLCDSAYLAPPGWNQLSAEIRASSTA